jgi:hypothetical protein
MLASPPLSNHNLFPPCDGFHHVRLRIALDRAVRRHPCLLAGAETCRGTNYICSASAAIAQWRNFHAAFQDGNSGSVGLLIHVKLRAHSLHYGGLGLNSEWAARIVCNLEERLTPQELDISMGLIQTQLNARVGVQSNDR